MRLYTLLAAILMLVSVPAAAAGKAGDYNFSLTPFLGYVTSGAIDGEEEGDELDLKDESAIGLILNGPARRINARDYTEWEVYVSHQSAGINKAPAGVDPSLKVDITHILVGGTYVGGGKTARPFLSAGIGAAHLSPDQSDYNSDTTFAFSIGVGAHIFPEKRIGLRTEARLLGAVIDSNSALFCSSGSNGGTCAFRASGELLMQVEFFVGITGRF
jgi:hypothetical protein